MNIGKRATDIGEKPGTGGVGLLDVGHPMAHIVTVAWEMGTSVEMFSDTPSEYVGTEFVHGTV